MVNIDTIYQRVLALANKEQRGYITPQEFNLFANQAQMDIFEQYFYDINQRERVPGSKNPYADIDALLEEKIEVFFISYALTAINDQQSQFILPDICYKIQSVTHKRLNKFGNEERVEVERMSWHELRQARLSPLTAPTLSRPAYHQRATSRGIGLIAIEPNLRTPGFITTTLNLGFIKKPIKANWTYVVVGGKPLVNNSTTAGYQDFELHASEETKLVIKILALAGITLKDPALYQAAAAEDNKSIQQEKQ